MIFCSYIWQNKHKVPFSVFILSRWSVVNQMLAEICLKTVFPNKTNTQCYCQQKHCENQREMVRRMFLACPSFSLPVTPKVIQNLNVTLFSRVYVALISLGLSGIQQCFNNSLLLHSWYWPFANIIICHFP